MPEQAFATLNPRSRSVPALPGLDSDATPLLGMGLGLTGLALGLNPRLAPLPLALTALVAVMYRNPERKTPDDPSMLFALVDGSVLFIDELYEHRYLHTDAIRIATILSPLDLAINRSPMTGVVRYVQHIDGEYHSPRANVAGNLNTRTYIGIEADWGPLLIVQIAGPLARRIVSFVQEGDHIEAGQRIGNVRFAARTDLIVQRDSIEPLVSVGQRLTAGITRIARLTPLPAW